MYRVYLGDTLIYDLSREITLIDPTVKLAESKAGIFEFGIAPENPGYELIKNLITLVTVVKVEKTAEVKLFKGRVIEEEKDFYNIKQVSCEGELAFLIDSIQRPKEYHNMTVRGLLQTWIDSHNKQVKDDTKTFQLGMVTVTDPNDSLYRYTNWENTLSCIREKLIDKLGGHIRVRNYNGIRYLDYLADYDNTNTQNIEFGENLLDYSENTTAADIATCCIPLGARLDESPIDALEAYTTIESVNGGSDYIYIPAAVDENGWITKTVSFDDTHVPSNLKTQGQKWLTDNQYETMTLTLTAVDLNLYDVDYERIKLGDLVHVKSEPHGMDRYFPVTELTIYLDAPEKNTVQLGDSGKSLTERTSSTANGIYSALEQIPTESHILKQAIDNATALITAATTGHVVTRPNEILIMDTDDIKTATKCWRWNINGLGYSSEGYNGRYETAMTMDGQIVGKFIAANSIAAEKLDITYRTEVEKQITLAEKNANGATDDKLKNYWTRVQVETSIKNTKEAILITAKEEATGYVDDSLKNYYSKAQIEVMTDSITESVTQEITNRQNEVTRLQGSIKTQAELIELKVSKGAVSSQLSVESGQVTISGNRLVVNATNFSLTAAGLATMKGANVNGTFRCTNGSYWLQCSNAVLYGGYDNTTYGSIDFVAIYSDSSMRSIRIRGRNDINLMGRISTATSPDATVLYLGVTDSITVLTDVYYTGNGNELAREYTTLTFKNGLRTG